MRKLLSLLLCLLLLSGCSSQKPEATTKATQPAEATAATETEPESTTPETTAPVEPELNTTVLRDSDSALRLNYVLVAVSEDAPFIAQGVAINEWGSNALTQWLMGETAREILADIGEAEYGEALFTLPTDETGYEGWISDATPATATIHLAMDQALVDAGLPEALLPVFEETYGYTVEVTGLSTRGALSNARNGYADLVLVESGPLAETLVTDGFARTVNGMEVEILPLCDMQYLLCGPREDPAGVADCHSVTESFAAIADGEYTFLSRGDGSTVHMLEQRFWGDAQLGKWHISAEMEMGPCLVMNELEGGYILTDKLTWLKYKQANGIA